MSREEEKFRGGNRWIRRMTKGRRLGHETTFVPTLLLTAFAVVIAGCAAWAGNREFHWFN